MTVESPIKTVRELNGKNLREIQVILIGKNIDELVRIYNYISDETIYENNDIDELDNLVPENMRVTAGLNSAKNKTYTIDDTYVYYDDRNNQLFSFTDIDDKYCPISYSLLAKQIYLTTLQQ